jgi:hypothetical protein
MRLRPAGWCLCLLCLAWPAWTGAEPELLRDQPTTLLYPPWLHTPLGIHRGTPELLALFVGDRARFTGPEGLACTRLLSEPAPPPESDDCSVTVLGVNTGQANLIYNPNLLGLSVLGDTRTGLGLFVRPLGAALRPDGVAYVTDPGRGRVLRLSFQDGRFVPAGELAPPPDGWREPWGVAVDAAGRAYVTDAGHDCVQVYDPTGAWVRRLGPALGPDFRWDRPRAVAVADRDELWSYYRDDYLYVCDRDGTRLSRLDPNDPAPRVQVTASVSVLPAAPVPARWAWLALDFYENLWVTDPDRGQLHKFNRHLEPLADYGAPGEGDGRFQRPSGVAINRHFGQVFVAEARGAHYLWIGADLLAPAARRIAGDAAIELRYRLTEPARVLITARPAAGGPAVQVFAREWTDSGPQQLAWACPAAWRTQAIVFTLTAEATYSSAHYYAKTLELTLPAL